MGLTLETLIKAALTPELEREINSNGGCSEVLVSHTKSPLTRTVTSGKLLILVSLTA